MITRQEGGRSLAAKLAPVPGGRGGDLAAGGRGGTHGLWHASVNKEKRHSLTDLTGSQRR